MEPNFARCIMKLLLGGVVIKPLLGIVDILILGSGVDGSSTLRGRSRLQDDFHSRSVLPTTISSKVGMAYVFKPRG